VWVDAGYSESPTLGGRVVPNFAMGIQAQEAAHKVVAGDQAGVLLVMSRSWSLTLEVAVLDTDGVRCQGC